MSFLQDYLEYTSGTETSETFHKWCCISALSSIVSRKVWIDQGRIRHYPNLYVVLVGDPGCGKSFALDHARKLVIELGIPCAPSAITLEALTEQLGEKNEKSPNHKIARYRDLMLKYTHITIFANELVTYLGTEPMKHINFLLEAWDQDIYHVKTKNKGEDYIKNPFVTFLGCMTPETSNALMKQQIINGGLSRRCIFVYATTRGKPVAFPELTEPQRAALGRLKARALALRDVVGGFTWTEEARSWFIAWYNAKYLKMVESHDLVMQGYLRTKDGMLLKVAMLLTLSDENSLTLTQKSLEQALDLLEASERHLPKILQGGGRNPLAHTAMLMQEDLQRYNRALPLKHFVANYFAHGSMKELYEAIDHLVDSGNAVKHLTLNNTFIAAPGVALQSPSPAPPSGKDSPS